jgi:hypothetical protein
MVEKIRKDWGAMPVLFEEKEEGGQGMVATIPYGHGLLLLRTSFSKKRKKGHPLGYTRSSLLNGI